MFARQNKAINWVMIPTISCWLIIEPFKQSESNFFLFEFFNDAYSDGCLPANTLKFDDDNKVVLSLNDSNKSKVTKSRTLKHGKRKLMQETFPTKTHSTCPHCWATFSTTSIMKKKHKMEVMKEEEHRNRQVKYRLSCVL